MLFHEACEQNILLNGPYPKWLHFATFVLHTKICFLYSNLPVFLCSVFLSPLTNKDGSKILNFIAPSDHILLHVMFHLKILKRQNSTGKKHINQQHANTAIIII